VGYYNTAESMAYWYFYLTNYYTKRFSLDSVESPGVLPESPPLSSFFFRNTNDLFECVALLHKHAWVESFVITFGFLHVFL